MGCGHMTLCNNYVLWSCDVDETVAAGEGHTQSVLQQLLSWILGEFQKIETAGGMEGGYNYEGYTLDPALTDTPNSGHLPYNGQQSMHQLLYIPVYTLNTFTAPK